MKKSNLTTEEEKQIQECINAFKTVNEGVAILYGNKTERKWALYLTRKYQSKVYTMIDFLTVYNKTIKSKYGLIRKPSELVTHLADLIFFKRKYDLEVQHAKHLKDIEDLEKKNFEEQKRIISEIPQEEKDELRNKRNEEMKRLIKGF